MMLEVVAKKLFPNMKGQVAAKQWYAVLPTKETPEDIEKPMI